jgi:hypothetical protein
MKTARTVRLALAAGATAAVVTGALIWSSQGDASARLASPPGGQSRASTISRAAAAVARGPGSRAVPVRCGTINPVIGYIGVPRTGDITEARQALGTALLAQVDGSAGGSLALIRPPSTFWYPNGAPVTHAMSATQRANLFSRWLPVRALPRQEDLRSCLYLMTDRPAAQPLIRAAVAAVARDGYVTSAARLRSELQEVLISDNPVARGSVIVTLMVTGRAYTPMAKGAPTLHRTASYTAIMSASGAHVTGAAEGGF